jgi:hypothetical protein
MRNVLLTCVLALSLAGCQTDLFCRQHNAATFAPSQEAWRAMTPAQRQDASRTFNEAARRCGWEP